MAGLGRGGGQSGRPESVVNRPAGVENYQKINKIRPPVPEFSEAVPPATFGEPSSGSRASQDDHIAEPVPKAGRSDRSVADDPYMISPEDYVEARVPDRHAETDAISHHTEDSEMETVIKSDPQTILEHAGDVIMHETDIEGALSKIYDEDFVWY